MLVEHITALGVNHKTAPVAVREKLAFSDGPVNPLQMIMNIPGCRECCFLSTCNRVEVLFVSDRPDTDGAIRDFLFANSELTEEEKIHYSYVYHGQDAVTHLFRVASSLDSMIVGEPQILGQLKGAYRQAAEQKCTGLILNRLVNKSFSVAKRIRTETNIGSSAVSISYAAVELAKKIFGELRGKKVLLAGAGEMAELAAEHLVNQGVSEVVVANRTFERAVKLARCFNGSAVVLEELIPQLAKVDILISSTGSPDMILRNEDVKPVMRQRKNSPLFLIDIAVPRDLDPALNDLDNVYLYDIDDLKNVIEINKAQRDKEATSAERIVAEETLKFLQWMEGIKVTPTIVEMKKKAESIRDAELAKTIARLQHLTDKEKKSIEIMAASIVNKLLHNPLLFLKKECPPEETEVKLDLVRKLFALNDTGHPNP